jgi:hypothetical protein
MSCMELICGCEWEEIPAVFILGFHMLWNGMENITP